ncbi:MAG TPA: hypothetical protein VMV69_08120 [Pirellulales bacterium]|nr:hypothetical protein [Pirellulales bacterium]
MTSPVVGREADAVAGAAVPLDRALARFGGRYRGGSQRDQGHEKHFASQQGEHSE